MRPKRMVCRSLRGARAPPNSAKEELTEKKARNPDAYSEEEDYCTTHLTKRRLTIRVQRPAAARLRQSAATRG